MLSKRPRSSARASILFCFEAHEKLGLGHLCRCRSIATEFTEQAEVDIFASCSEEDVFRSVFEGLPYRLVKPEEIYNGAFFDVVVVDIPQLSYESQQSFRKICRLLIGINDSGEGPFDYDVIIRPNFLQLPVPRMTRADAQILAGRDYIILHPAFSNLTPSVGKPDKAKELLVCLGGSDPGGSTLRVIPVLRQLPVDIRINVVIGQGFSQPEKAVDLIGDDERFCVLLNVPNLAGMFNICGAALVAGGTLMYEACALGVPSVVICQNEEQEREAAIFAGQHAVLNLGSAADVSDNIIINAVEKVCCDIDLRKELSRNAKEMVPRTGVRRVAATILGKLGRTAG
jgi:spore coat polysaccharide biosynthesis predicted glycosyltransferase SpsG